MFLIIHIAAKSSTLVAPHLLIPSFTLMAVHLGAGDAYMQLGK
jgi:hypothetical protein